MKYPMKYPKVPNFRHILEQLTEYSRLKFEYGAENDKIQSILHEAEKELQSILDKVKGLEEDRTLSEKEPDDLQAIRSLRPDGPRILWTEFDKEKYFDRLKGAFLGRMAGCTLGAPVEFWSVEAMKAWAEYIGDTFPPTDYWSSIKNPNDKRYGISTFADYTRDQIVGVPVDDDVTYTLLGLLIAEDYGLDFSIGDVGKAWLKHLPYACTAEDIALKNLKANIPAEKAGEINNPYCQWIGADIRSDPWGYLAPGLPEKAAELAYRDAYISHRRNGIYGEMYFSAVIAAAFEVDNAIDALEIGLSEIPADCLLSVDMRWALEAGKEIRNYAEARKAVEERFGDMSGVHTNLNACLTIFGLMIGADDFTKVIGETVAMGYDNDCTAATAGSIAGAILGTAGIPEHWYRNFNNKVLTYMNGHPEFCIEDVVNRFAKQAETLFK
ncbi:MAG: ADP-ribosylglycohydrolase family protein [Clostridia bacterium]|nr:ADP-ribosylglycohydrolase family protein [Clostridia bacterium]MDD4680190.1 ADP-ribosylglycohydrolase family protein [Clostridia bacterium]